jgi:hypothetical protein
VFFSLKKWAQIEAGELVICSQILYAFLGLLCLLLLYKGGGVSSVFSGVIAITLRNFLASRLEVYTTCRQYAIVCNLFAEHHNAIRSPNDVCQFTTCLTENE